MKNLKLHQILENFTQKEIKEISELITTEFLGGQFKHLACLRYCQKNHNNLLSKEELSKICFPDKPFNEVNIRLLLSETTKLIEKYVAMKMAVCDKDYLANAILVKTKNRGNENLFSKLIKKDKKRNSQKEVKNDAYFDQINFLFLEEYDFNTSKSRNADFHLQEMVDATMYKHSIEMMRICCLSVSHGIVSGIKYDLSYILSNIQFIEKKNLDDNKTLKLFMLCYNILTLPFENKNFEELQKTLVSGIQEIGERDAKIIYTILINFCIRQFNFGNIEYGIKTIDLYKTGIDNTFLLNQGSISIYTYRNLVTLAIKTDNIDQAKSMAQAYQSLLKINERNSSYEFAQSQIDYALKDYDNAQKRLSKISFEDHLLNLAAKTMLLKIFYITQEFELLSFHLDAMKMYILRKKVIGYHKENYLNIILVMKKISKLSVMSRTQKNELYKWIEDISPLSEKPWFLQCVKGVK